MEEETPIPLVTQVKTFLQSFFSKVDVYINNQENFNLKWLCAQKSYISNNVKGTISEYKWVLQCGFMTLRNILMILWKLLCRKHFHKENEKAE